MVVHEVVLGELGVDEIQPRAQASAEIKHCILPGISFFQSHLGKRSSCPEGRKPQPLCTIVSVFSILTLRVSNHRRFMCLVPITYPIPPPRVQVQSRRLRVLAHLFFRPPADRLFLFEVHQDHRTEKRPFNRVRELSDCLLRKRGACEEDRFGIQPFRPLCSVECAELLTCYFGEASLACTHDNLWGPSWCSFLHPCEETEDREQSATKQGRCAERVGRVDGLTGNGRTAWERT